MKFFQKNPLQNRKFWGKSKKSKKVEKVEKSTLLRISMKKSKKNRSEIFSKKIKILRDFVGTVSICFAAQQCRETVSLVHINNLY